MEDHDDYQEQRAFDDEQEAIANANARGEAEAHTTNENRCPYCYAQLKKYWHSITPGLVRVLIKCYKYVSSNQENLFKMKDLNLDHSEYGNFQKLRFHGLIAKHKIDGDIEERVWLITHRGADFLKGLIQIPDKVQTFRNRVVDHNDVLVTVGQVMAGQVYWEQTFDYDLFQPTQTKLV